MMYNFGNIEKIVFLGGSKILYGILKNLEGGVPVVVFTSSRFCSEIVSDGVTFEKCLIDKGVKYYIVDNLNDCSEICEEVEGKNALGFSVSASWIIKQNIIDLFSGKLINIHGAKLPQNRGGGGISWNILQGNRLGYYAFHFITTGIDDGDILYYEEFVYPNGCKFPQDYSTIHQDNIIESSGSLLKKIQDHEDFLITSQSECLSSYWPRLNTNVHGYINWNWSLTEIERFITAFDEPFPGAITYINGREVRLKDVSTERNDGLFHPFQKGIIFRKNKLGYFVATEEGTLFIRTISNSDGESLYSKVRVGDRLYTPQEKIDKMFQTRVFYGPDGLIVK